MKERNLLYFVSAVILTVFFLLSLIARTQEWFRFYGNQAIPPYYQLILPLILIWGGWFFDLKRIVDFVVAIVLVMFTFHLVSVVGVIGSTAMPSGYAPMVKTYALMSLIIMIGFVVVALFEDIKNAVVSLKKPTE